MAKQLLLNLTDGKPYIETIPAVVCSPNRILIATRKTVVSPGTERMLIDFGKGNWLEKMRQQPDKVRMVLNKARTDGIAPTIEAVKSKLDQPLPLGYCNAGIVLETRAIGFTKGDRVVSNGPHSSVVQVPANLCARIPDSVDDESAAFTVLGAIALQGIRLANPTLGETVVVSGLGVIGLLCVQLLRANGCRVLGLDYDARRCQLAEQFGAGVVNLSKEEAIPKADAFSRGRGVDAVIIAAATKSNEPISHAARMLRKRGRIILVGVAGLQLSRSDFYDKELTFQVSCSYGPGRYDRTYEEKGHDYPVGFVRWTEQRNFEAVLDMMAAGSLDAKSLITHRFSFEDALLAYDKLDSSKSLGILLDYSANEDEARPKVVELAPRSPGRKPSRVVCGVIGGGNYAARVLLPALGATGAELHTLATKHGISAVHHGRNRGFARAVSDEGVAFQDPRVNTIVIATRHDLHAGQVVSGLDAGKHVFAEKPLALTLEELEAIERVYRDAPDLLLMVGFNRRFAPHSVKIRELLAHCDAPKAAIVTVNAGAIPVDHWTQDSVVGGGRITGEGCHFVDLLRFLIGRRISGFKVSQVPRTEDVGVDSDNVTITLSFDDGSIGTIHYLANGDRSFPKERIEVFCGGAVLQLDNFRRLKGFGWRGFKRMNLLSQDKGNKRCITAFIESIEGGKTAPIQPEELFEVSRYTIEISNELRNQRRT